jgi:hypothetical protein
MERRCILLPQIRHGVGMSQRGAQTMANLGFGYCTVSGDQRTLGWDESHPGILNFYLYRLHAVRHAH